MSPLVSIIILYLNRPEYLKRCLFCLGSQTFRNFEVILIDNGSKDNWINDLSHRYQSLSLNIKKFDKNLGFALANNIGARLAGGKYLALLNADAFPEPDWLERLLEVAESNSNAFFTSRQIQFKNPDYLDGEGDNYHVSGYAWRNKYASPIYPLSKPQEVFSACGAAAFYPRQAFLDAGGFDEDYFSYHEDVDLGFRLRLIGGRCLYVPQAVVYHVGSASTGKASDFAFYHGHRNLVWTFFKDMPAALFWVYLPLHMMMNIYLSATFLLKQKRRIVLKSKIDAFRALPAILRKRKHTQQSRTVSSGDIYRVMSKGLLAPHWASRERKTNKHD
jgi:GT2 family glycosyltransferase